jgi:ABC-type multidrug transport system fused ATPase/permease subunit
MKVEQYGNLPDYQKIEHFVPQLQASIDEYVAKDKNDHNSFMKGLFAAQKWKFAGILILRIALSSQEIIMPLLIAEMMKWIQSREEESLEQTLRMVAFGMLIPAFRCSFHTIWEYFCYYMIECGHMTHCALKVILFRKNFRMTEATNKDFSSGEISGIVMNESDRIWTFIFEGPAYFTTAFHIISALYIIFQEVGYSGLVALVITALRLALKYFKGKMSSDVSEQQRGKKEQRTLYINESFNNIKAVKLFGWEPDFLEKVDSVYKEELVLEDKQETREMIFTFLDEVLQASMSIAVFTLYMYLGNTLTLSKLALTTLMLNSIRGKVSYSQRLY